MFDVESIFWEIEVWLILSVVDVCCGLFVFRLILVFYSVRARGVINQFRYHRVFLGTSSRARDFFRTFLQSEVEAIRTSS